MSQIIDSDRRCPFDSKRMLVEIGQDDISGWTRMVHFCLQCDYWEIDENWPRPKLTVVGRPSAAERLKQLRMGEVIPLHYDASPFPAGDLDAS